MLDCRSRSLCRALWDERVHRNERTVILQAWGRGIRAENNEPRELCEAWKFESPLRVRLRGFAAPARHLAIARVQS